MGNQNCLCCQREGPGALNKDETNLSANGKQNQILTPIQVVDQSAFNDLFEKKLPEFGEYSTINDLNGHVSSIIKDSINESPYDVSKYSTNSKVYNAKPVQFKNGNIYAGIDKDSAPDNIIPGNVDDDVLIYITDNHIVFDFDTTTVVSRLIEGEYFKIDQMLSTDYETKVKINKKELLSCIDRSTLLVKEGDKKPIIMNITDGNMELKINSFIGSMNEDIDITKDGKDVLIGFNPKFFIDALRVIDEEEVNLYMVNPKAPCFIKDDEGKFIYLILPVNINSAAN